MFKIDVKYFGVYRNSQILKQAEERKILCLFLVYELARMWERLESEQDSNYWNLTFLELS